MKYFLTVVIVGVVLAVGAGLFAVGSPAQERLRRFDSLRVSHLQMIQSELYSYWNANKKLPDTLAVFDGRLTNGYSSFTPPKDPVTGEMYTYTKKGEDTFTLCATFALPATDDSYSSAYGPYGPTDWKYAAGNVCFERVFDKLNWPAAEAPVKS